MAVDAKTKLNPFLFSQSPSRINQNIFGRLSIKILEKILGLDRLAKKYSQLQPTRNPSYFLSQAFKYLDIDYEIATGEMSHIPRSGPAIVVANHPFGSIDGMAMIHALRNYRKDSKIMANGLLQRIPDLKDAFIGVNPYEHTNAIQQNAMALRKCFRWLNKGGLIIVFPAGDVSKFKMTEMRTHDGVWDEKIARLALRSKASVTPIYIEGRNSIPFYLANLIHPMLKTLLYPRQLLNKIGKTVRLHIGKTISTDRIQKINDTNKIIELLRSKTYELSHPKQLSDRLHKTQSINPPPSNSLMQQEIEKLPGNQLLGSQGDFDIYYADNYQISSIMEEIGRLREVSYRLVGEGSGNQTDIDNYDTYYKQLFIWDRANKEIVGGYRMGLTDEIIKTRGKKGLYTQSLFKYKKKFITKNPPSIELGRSFIRPEHQKSFLPLMLLWKGIANFVYRHPRYCILFGPVSISNDYSKTSQQLMINYLNHRMFNRNLNKFVKPRSPYKIKKSFNIDLFNIDNMPIDQLSSLITSIEDDEKGIPVLLRQYLKLGGTMLGFNIDKDFGHCVDGLIYVDLRETNIKSLSKYMGTEQAQAYLERHRQTYSAVA